MATLLTRIIPRYRSLSCTEKILYSNEKNSVTTKRSPTSTNEYRRASDFLGRKIAARLLLSEISIFTFSSTLAFGFMITIDKAEVGKYSQ
jgi:hypothetical protein